MDCNKYKDEIRRMHEEALSASTKADICGFGAAISCALTLFISSITKEEARTLLDGMEKAADIMRSTNRSVPDDVQDARDKIGSIFKK